MIRHTHLKSAGLVGISLVISGVLFFTIGSRTRVDNTQGCSEYSGSALVDCPLETVQGIPLTYRDNALDLLSRTHPGIQIFGIVLDIAVWSVVGGIIAFGGAMLIPDKLKKRS